MLNLSYNLSPILKERLKEIESLREKILLFPISPVEEIRRRWETTIDKIYSSFVLSNYDIDKKKLTKTLTAQINLTKGENLKNITEDDREMLGYKRALDLISKNWNVEPKNVLVRDIFILYDTFCDGRLTSPISRLQELLDYIQAHKENPIIQAGVCYLGIENIRPFSKGNSRLARLLSYLFLYKNGYDVKGFIEFEKSWSLDKQTYLEALRIGLSAKSITLWLEFFAGEISANLSEIFEKIRLKNFDNIGLDSSFWNLNDRQKEILILLQEPNSNITNKKVQKRFKVSQITASRDLSKLYTLGYIFQRGKGRSVYYTKF